MYWTCITILTVYRRWENRFKYIPTYGALPPLPLKFFVDTHFSSLWIGYAIVIFIAFISIVVGSVSLSHNGMCSDTTFSKILVTTRNPTLDRVVMSYPGVALGGDPMPKELERTELQFGVIDVKRDDENTPLLMPHTAFGLAKETSPINKNDVRQAIEAQGSSDIELGSHGALFPGTGLGALPG
jgi:hypothetical protein